MATTKRRRVLVTPDLCGDVIGVVMEFLCIVDACRVARTNSAFADAVRGAVQPCTLPAAPFCASCDLDDETQQPYWRLKVDESNRTQHRCWGLPHCRSCCSRARRAIKRPVQFHIKGGCVALSPEVLLFMNTNNYQLLRTATCVHVIKRDLDVIGCPLDVFGMVRDIFERTVRTCYCHLVFGRRTREYAKEWGVHVAKEGITRFTTKWVYKH
jgi:hypothetical protein